MPTYSKASCWAAAIASVALAGALGLIDEASTTTLLIALPMSGWAAITGRGWCPARRGVSA